MSVSIGLSPTVQGGLGLAAVLASLSGRLRERFFLKTGFLILAALVLADFSNSRPDGLFKNALSAGEALSLFAVATGNPILAFAGGFTGSRATLAVTGIAGVMVVIFGFPSQMKIRRRAGLMVLAGTVAGLGAWAAINGIERFTPGAIETAGELRAETYHNPGGLFGSGFGAYQGQRPHNVFISLWAQMGVLSVPVWVTIAWHARRADWRLFPALLPSAFLNDWIVSAPSGIMAVGLYIALMDENQERPEQAIGRDD
jgi:hypothetical protein